MTNNDTVTNSPQSVTQNAAADITEVTPIPVIADTTGPKEAESDAEIIDPTKNCVVEAVIWNNAGVSISVGAAVLNKDQLHIDVRKTCDLPKTLPKEAWNRLIHIKPEEGRLFKLTEPLAEPGKEDSPEASATA